MKFKSFSFLSTQELVKDKLGFGTYKVAGNEAHLQAAAEWILRAQSVGPDKGVSRMYSLLNGWGPSYPETTGYIIPTLIEYSKKSDNQKFLKHALEMCNWELEIQLDCGAVMAGTIDADPVVPTIFNTGQNLFGWIAAYKATDDEKYLSAAIKAASWMAEAQNENGVWTKFHSPFAKYEINTYNVRSAWGMCEVYGITKDAKLLEAVEKNVHWVLTQQNEHGWFDNNCLSDNNNPLTHTIGYTVEGLLGIGLALGDELTVFAAKKNGGRVSKGTKTRWKPARSIG